MSDYSQVFIPQCNPNNESHDDSDFRPHDNQDQNISYSDCIYLNKNANGSIPANYYSPHFSAYVDSIGELNRYIGAAKAGKFDNLKRVAFLEWYLKNHGFNVSFVISNSFSDMRQVHIWLIYRNRRQRNDINVISF